MIYEQVKELIEIAKKEATEKCINYIKDHPAAVNISIDIATRYDNDLKAAIIAVLSSGGYDCASKEFTFLTDEMYMEQYLRIYKGIQDNISYWVPVKNHPDVKTIPIVYKYRDIMEGRL